MGASGNNKLNIKNYKANIVLTYVPETVLGTLMGINSFNPHDKSEINMISHIFVGNNILSGSNSQSVELASVPRQSNAPHVPVATVVV